MVMILLAGILFFVGLLTDSIQAFIGAYINTASPTFGKIFLSILNQLLFVIIVTTWFAVLFRFLTNGRPSWKTAIRGGLLTGILFTLGKYILRIMLPLSNIGNVYGASVHHLDHAFCILFFVYLLLWRLFVKVLSDSTKRPIRPIKGAFLYELKEIVKEKN